jgi:hypothetical protein
MMTIYHDKWEDKAYACGECDWTGKGADCGYGLFHRKRFLELLCPSCRAFVDLIIFPESHACGKNSDKLTDEQKRELQEQGEQMRLYREKCLQSQDQLPEIADSEFSLVWDQEKGDTQIRKGDSVIWSEPVAYEGFERFELIALILKEKYGTRLRDLEPTDRSMLFLYGDLASSIDYVEKLRKNLFGIQ